MNLDAWAQAEGVRSGALSAVELVEESLRAVEEYDEQVNAFALLLREEALASAEEIDRTRPDLPLAGVPVSVKDHIWLAGVRATNGSLALADHVPAADAACVARLKAAGAVV